MFYKVFALSMVVLTSLLNPSICTAKQRTRTVEATVERTFTINNDFDKVIRWIDTNRETIRNTTGIVILEKRQDGSIKVQRRTPKGLFIWAMREQITRNEDQIVYQTFLVDSIQGGLEASESTIRITKKRGHTEISIKIYSRVNNPRITVRDLQLSLNHEIKRVERLLSAHLDSSYPFRPDRPERPVCLLTRIQR